jgi:hypothetical protein
MKLAISALAATAAIGLGTGIAACGGSSPVIIKPAPTTTVTRPPAPPATTAPASPAPAAPAPAATPAGGSNVTDPWAVVSAYYGDVESGNVRQAWRLIGSGSTTGQTYQQFVDGYACTGSQDLTEVGESGNTVTFNLTATDSCTGQVQHYSGTDSVQNGTIVADNVRLDR